MVSIRRHLALLRGELRPTEAERLWVRAERRPQGHAGALVLTDQRLLFSGLGFVAQSQEAWPLAVVTDVVVAGDALTLRALGVEERFTGRSADVARLAGMLPAGEGRATGPLVDELERLAALRDSGVLTAGEFESAKRRLLS